MANLIGTGLSEIVHGSPIGTALLKGLVATVLRRRVMPSRRSGRRSSGGLD
jgi:hypothetical protein